MARTKKRTRGESDKCGENNTDNTEKRPKQDTKEDLEEEKQLSSQITPPPPRNAQKELQIGPSKEVKSKRRLSFPFCWFGRTTMTH